MENEEYKNSLIAVATNTNKSENQDSGGEFKGVNFNSIFIADGLGSFVHPRIASEQVIEFFKAKASSLKVEDGKRFKPNFLTVFKEAKERLIEYAKQNIKEEEKQLPNLLGTTAIIVFETEEKLFIAYTGNGAVWHIRGNFNEFPDAYQFPWNVVNFLNPHTIPEGGKEALYKLISDSPDFNECIPSVIEIEKDKILGDVIMICTDGIYSADQVKAGKNEKGVWVKYEPSMLTFFKTLNNYFKVNYYNLDMLKVLLKIYLEEIKPSLDDDATIGVLITKEVLNYQKKKVAVSNEANTGIKV